MINGIIPDIILHDCPLVVIPLVEPSEVQSAI